MLHASATAAACPRLRRGRCCRHRRRGRGPLGSAQPRCAATAPPAGPQAPCSTLPWPCSRPAPRSCPGGRLRGRCATARRRPEAHPSPSSAAAKGKAAGEQERSLVGTKGPWAHHSAATKQKCNQLVKAAAEAEEARESRQPGAHLAAHPGGSGEADRRHEGKRDAQAAHHRPRDPEVVKSRPQVAAAAGGVGRGGGAGRGGGKAQGWLAALAGRAGQTDKAASCLARLAAHM